MVRKSAKKKIDWKATAPFLVATAIGAIVGALLGTTIHSSAMLTIIVLTSVVSLTLVYIRPNRWLSTAPAGSVLPAAVGVFVYALLNLYGGIVAVDSAILRLVVLVLVLGLPLSKANPIKVVTGLVLFAISSAIYYLEKLHPRKDFDILGLGLASETLSGLSEDGHAGGKFPRPCLFERLGRLLDKAKPEIVFACYGMNDGIYQPLDDARFTAFKKGVARLIDRCKAAGVKEVVLITPPIYDFTAKKDEFNYDSVLTAYAKWETELQIPGVRVIDLHTAMRKARDARPESFSKDRVHPGDDGNLLMARMLLAALGVKTPDEALADIKKDPLYKLVAEKRALRSAQWMKHIGYTREAVVAPQALGTVEADAAKIQEKIDALRRPK